MNGKWFIPMAGARDGHFLVYRVHVAYGIPVSVADRDAVEGLDVWQAAQYLEARYPVKFVDTHKTDGWASYAMPEYDPQFDYRSVISIHLCSLANVTASTLIVVPYRQGCELAANLVSSGLWEMVSWEVHPVGTTATEVFRHYRTEQESANAYL